MSKHFLLSWKDSIGASVSAFAPKDAKAGHELISHLDGSFEFPFEFTLVKVVVAENGLMESNDLSDLNKIWLDYLPNNLGWPLMSQRLKFIIESKLTGNEQVEWVSCKVSSESEKKMYYIIRFNKVLDVLDINKTLFVPGTDHIIKPVFAASKIKDYSIFPKPLSHNLWKITAGLYVSESIKKTIVKEKLIEIDFTKALVI